MKTTSLSMKLLRIVAELGRIGGILIFTISLLAIVLVLINPDAKIFSKINSDFFAPVKFIEAQQGKYVTANEKEYAFKIESFESQLPIGSFPAQVKIPFFILTLASGILLFLCFNFFRSLLLQITGNGLFKESNLLYLKRIGLTLVGLYFVDALGKGILSVFIQMHIQYEHLKPFSQLTISVNSYLLLALICWALIVVFKYGNQLREENELTV